MSSHASARLVAPAGARTVERRDELESGMPARVLDAVARLVRELAEVHFPRMGRQAEHEDVRPGTENPVLEAGDDDAAHFRVLETDAVQRVVELDVDAQIVAVELELVARTDARVLGDVDRKRRNGSVERQLPVAIAGRIGPIVDRIGLLLIVAPEACGKIMQCTKTKYAS